MKQIQLKSLGVATTPLGWTRVNNRHSSFSHPQITSESSLPYLLVQGHHLRLSNKTSKQPNKDVSRKNPKLNPWRRPDTTLAPPPCCKMSHLLNPGNLLSPSVLLGLQSPTPRVWPCLCLLDFYPRQDDLRAWYDDCVSTKHLRGTTGVTSCNQIIKFVRLSSYVSHIWKGLYKNIKKTLWRMYKMTLWEFYELYCCCYHTCYGINTNIKALWNIFGNNRQPSSSISSNFDVVSLWLQLFIQFETHAEKLSGLSILHNMYKFVVYICWFWVCVEPLFAFQHKLTYYLQDSTIFVLFSYLY